MAQRYTLLLQCHDEMAGKRGHQQKNIKKIAGCSTTYPKSPYLCNVLIKQLIVLRFKKAKKMKKLVLMAVAIVAVSFDEKVSFDGRSHCSRIFRILWW